MDDSLIRSRCRELSTEELVREVLLFAEGYRPEALAIYRAELESRLGDIQKYIQQEHDDSGEERLRVRLDNFYQSQPQAPSAEDLPIMNGELICTTTGLGFIPSKRSELFSHGGLEGWWSSLLNEVYSATGVGGAHRLLPLSLLAKTYKASFFVAHSELSSVSIMGPRLRMTLTQRGYAGGELPENARALVAWGEEFGVRVDYRERPPSLWETVKGLFGKT